MALKRADWPGVLLYGALTLITFLNGQQVFASARWAAVLVPCVVILAFAAHCSRRIRGQSIAARYRGCFVCRAGRHARALVSANCRPIGHLYHASPKSSFVESL